jgi:hypothetical protein
MLFSTCGNIRLRCGQRSKDENSEPDPFRPRIGISKIDRVKTRRKVNL